MDIKTTQSMAEAHWDYVESVLRSHNERQEVIDKCHHHYVTAFVHGFKHGAQQTGGKG